METQSELNHYGADPKDVAEALRQAAVGKTIADISLENDGTDKRLTIAFDDGTWLIVKSWDYEGYSSGIYVYDDPVSASDDA